jgi:iron complex outermembrane receptor protein
MDMTRSQAALFWAAAAVLLLPAPVFAQSSEDLMNLPLEKLLNVEITSASKYAEKSSQAPSAVEVISADDIRTFGYRTLGEALDGLHGLFTESDRYYNYLGVRGFRRPGDYNSRVLIMVDGRRMNDNIYDETDTGQLFMLDMALVDHIEYIPGPGSSIYGANAVLGVINVISKKGSDINGLQVQGDAGSFDTHMVRGTYGKHFDNGADVVLSGSQFYSLGPHNLFFPEFNSPATNNGFAHDLDGERAEHLFAKISYGDFTFHSGYVDRFKQDPTAPFGTLFNDAGFNTNDSVYYSELNYNKALNSKTQLELEAFDQWYWYNGNLPYDANPTPPPVTRVDNYDAVEGRWMGGEAKLVTTAFDRQKIVAGVEYQYDARQRVFNFDISPFTLYQDHNRAGSRVGVYGQDDISLRDNLVLSTGLRVDENHMLSKIQVNPRLALIWNPRPSTTLKAVYGSAFRAPNVYERDINTFGGVANPNNIEERIKTYETVAEWQPGTGLKLSGSLFYNDFKQVLQRDDATGMFLNTGRFYSYGYDLGAEKRWTNGRELKTSFDHSLLYDLSTTTAVWAIGSPRYVSKTQYAEPLFDGKAKLGVENVFVDERNTPQNVTAGWYDLVNANLGSDKIVPGAYVSFAGYNLFNAHPQMVGGVGTADFVQAVIPMNGRSIYAMIQYTF